MDVNEYNAKIIEEFRANGGRVGGSFEGVPMVLLTTTGARSGAARVNPLMYLPDGGRSIVFAAKGGAPTNPDWYYNLRANPAVTIDIGAERHGATATVLEGEERDRLYAEQASRYPQFAEYQARTSRRIPVIALTPKA